MRVRDARGFTIGELIIVILIVVILAAMAFAMLKQARISANESSAIGAMRAIVGAQASYASFNNGFAGSLEQLSVKCAGMTQPFITEALNRNGVTRSGYIFNVRPGKDAISTKLDCAGTPTHSVFYATAVPEILFDSGSRAFAANTTAVIWQNTTGIPPAEPIVAGGTVSVIGR